MEGCLFDIAKNEVQSLANLVKNEAQYLCCFNSYVETFDQKKKILEAKNQDMKRKFQKGKGVFSFKFEAWQWKHEADRIIHTDPKIRKKLFFGWCPNCWWQYRRGKELAGKTQHIEELLGRCNSNIAAGRAKISNIKALSSQDFIYFESRESKFQDLLKALQDDNCNMIGLQGIGGAGKTSMAKEVGHKLKESKLIDKFIFLVVSKPPDFKKLRNELAKGLDLNSEEVKEEELSNTIWSRITNMNEKLLIILDDVWEQFDLTENLGIPSEHQYKGYSLLITTRNLRVCAEMGCQTIELQTLTDEEALNLFISHASMSSSSRGLKGMPPKIVKRCGGVPVAIVAIARALKNQPISVWKDALKTLEDHIVDQNLEEAYKCLKLSYDHLKNLKAKELLLISSSFPEDFEIPIKVLTEIGIGLGSFNENDKYYLKKGEVHGAIMELVESSLLLKGEEEYVKMHDLVRETALWIGDKDIQSLMDLKMPIKKNLRYLFWTNDDFPNEFDGNKLEVLLIFLDSSEDLNVSDTFFKEMTSLKVLVLVNSDDGRIPALPLTNSLQPLKDIQVIVLQNLELGDISVLGNLLSLGTLWFYDCSIIELPREFLKLKKLRSLEVEGCKIEKNNPFEVIESCLELEELTFVNNECDNSEKDTISQNRSPPTLHKYCISSEDVSDYIVKYGSMSRCFRIDGLRHLVSDTTFKQLAGKAELLILEGEDMQRTRKNLFPDIIAIDEGGILNDLIVLHLSSFPNMECLVDTKDHDFAMTALCNLAELHLSYMSVEDLCQGPLPSGFFEQLEIMKLNECHKLKSILSNANCNLCRLKSMELGYCSNLTSLFQPSTARSLMQLEELTIRSCSALEYIIVGEDGDSNQKSYYDSLFPKLKIFQISNCNKLRIILPILFIRGLASLEKINIHKSEQLEYIFDKFQEQVHMLPSLKELQLSEVPSFIGIFREHQQLMSSSMQKPSSPLSRHNSIKINQSPAMSAFYWVQACCSLYKPRLTSEKTNVDVSEHRLLGPTKPSELHAPTNRDSPLHVAQSLLVQPLMNVREIKLVECLNLISLSTLAIAASTILLENLTIKECHKLKCITTHEGNAQVDNNYCSIFPKLENMEIDCCKELEFLFLPTISGGLEKLKSLTIKRVPKLKYVIGNYQKEQHSSNQIQSNDELHFDLLALETLYIGYAPKIDSICTKNYKLLLSSLHNVDMWNCGIDSFPDYNNMENWKATKELDASTNGVFPFLAAQSLLAQPLENVREIKLVNCWNLISLSTLSIAVSTIALQNLSIRECHKLKGITRHEGDAQVDENYYSIFPRLENLEIANCRELEFLFVSVISGGLKKLKSLTIEEVPELTYIVGKYQKEQHSSNQNQNDHELHFDLLALEILSIKDAPKFDGICAKNYKLVLSSLQNIEMKNCGVKSFTYYNMVNLTTTEEVHASTNGTPLFHAVHNLLIQSLKNIRKMKLEHCNSLISVLTLSIASTFLLEDLTIEACDHLKCIVAHEEDDRTPMNYNSIFPKLKHLRVSNCDALEYLFPAYAFKCPAYLESLRIYRAPMLKYVFARSQLEDNLTYGNHNIQTYVDFPALKDLSIGDVPELVHVYPENYYLRGLSIRSIVLQKLPKFTMRCSNEFFVFWHTKQQKTKVIEMSWQTLESLQLWDFKIEEIFVLTYVDTKKNRNGFEPLTSSLQKLELGNLSEMVNLCVGPKRIICFHSLQELTIIECKTLKVIFSTSTVRRLPMLSVLYISKCEELVHIVEEDYETNVDDHLLHEPCFPKLKQVSVRHCDKLKYLFSITISGIIPKLNELSIREADELEHVLIRRGEMKEMAMKDVLPTLRYLSLAQLPNLVSVCQGINFQILKDRTYVFDCPEFSFNEIVDSQVEEKAEEKLSSHLSTEQSLSEGEAIQQSLMKEIHEATKEIVEEDFISEMAKTTISSSDSKLIGRLDKLVDREMEKETIMMETESQERTRRHYIQYHREEEEEREGGLITTRRHRSDIKVESSLLKEKTETSIHGDPFIPCTSTILSEQTSEAILPLSLISSKASTSFVQTSQATLYGPTNDGIQVSDKSHAAVIGNVVPIPQPNFLHKGVSDEDIQETNVIQHESSCSRGQIEHSHDVTKSNINQALDVAKVQEIVDMMKLEGSETCLLAEALKTHPQLHLSTNDRSTEMMCVSYSVLISILNILTTKTPFTITEADKRLLEEKLKDAYLLGFDKDWLESVKTRVFNCDASEVDGIQEILKGLDNDLKANEAMLEATRNQEVEAARVVELAQKDLEAAMQEHTNVMANHTHLLKARQDILARQNQCWEMIAAKTTHFGF